MNPTSQLTDREIREAFHRRASAPPTHDLIDRIHQEIRTVKQNRPLFVIPGLRLGASSARLAWAAVLAALLIVLVSALVFVGSQRRDDLSVVPTLPSATPPASAEASADTSPSPDGSGEPSPAPSIAPSDAPFDLERGIATVLADSLRVRSEPGISADSQMLTPLLTTGQSVYVVDGPIPLDGYDWYGVAPRDADGSLSAGLPKGWVAIASRDGEPWLSPIESGPCPTGGLTIEALIAIGDGGACYGSAEITVPASPAIVDVLGGVCFPVEDYPTCAFEPDWLVQPTYAVHPSGSWVGSRPIAWLAAAPGAELAEWGGSQVTFELTGHFADPAAATCRIYDTETDEPLIKTADQVISDCERTFVVTSAGPATR